MAKSDSEQAERVRSAKTWLEKAEKSFDQHASVRGELNLMLAEAEMKNLRKNHKAGRKLRQLAAACTIALSAAILLTAYGFLNRETVVMPAREPQSQAEAPAVAQSGSAAVVQEQERQQEEIQPEEQSPVSQALPAAELSEGKAVQGTEEAVPAAEPYTMPAQAAKVMSDREVQAAVQDARHSLRGTAEKK